MSRRDESAIFIDQFKAGRKIGGVGVRHSYIIRCARMRKSPERDARWPSTSVRRGSFGWGVSGECVYYGAGAAVNTVFCRERPFDEPPTKTLNNPPCGGKTFRRMAGNALRPNKNVYVDYQWHWSTHAGREQEEKRGKTQEKREKSRDSGKEETQEIIDGFGFIIDEMQKKECK